MAPDRGRVESATEENSHFQVDFIDPLFAVVISIGFTEAIMNEHWFSEWRMPRGDEWFQFETWLLALLTLVLSWVGYHQSIRPVIGRPIKGLARFFLDVIIVILYGLMLIRFEDLPSELFLLAATYFFFSLWDIAKIYEYRTDPRWQKGSRSKGDFYHREIVTGIWFLFFSGLWYIHSLGFSSDWSLILAFIGAFAYRVHKKIRVWHTIRHAK